MPLFSLDLCSGPFADTFVLVEVKASGSNMFDRFAHHVRARVHG